VTKNCPSRTDGLFLAIKPKRGVSEKEIGEKAYQEIKQKNMNKSEFFSSLDFLVTFLAMKKVTKQTLMLNQ